MENTALGAAQVRSGRVARTGGEGGGVVGGGHWSLLPCREGEGEACG